MRIGAIPSQTYGMKYIWFYYNLGYAGILHHISSSVQTRTQANLGFPTEKIQYCNSEPGNIFRFLKNWLLFKLEFLFLFASFFLPLIYFLLFFTVCVKRNAHLIPIFFVAPLGEGGQKSTWSIMNMGVLYMLNFFCWKICNRFEDILKGVEACFKTKIAVFTNLHKDQCKSCNFHSQHHKIYR